MASPYYCSRCCLSFTGKLTGCGAFIEVRPTDRRASLLVDELEQKEQDHKGIFLCPDCYSLLREDWRGHFPPIVLPKRG